MRRCCDSCTIYLSERRVNAAFDIFGMTAEVSRPFTLKYVEVPFEESSLVSIYGV